MRTLLAIDNEKELAYIFRMVNRELNGYVTCIKALILKILLRLE